MQYDNNNNLLSTVDILPIHDEYINFGFTRTILAISLLRFHLSVDAVSKTAILVAS